jgi:hypothetical protein
MRMLQKWTSPNPKFVIPVQYHQIPLPNRNIHSRISKDTVDLLPGRKKLHGPNQEEIQAQTNFLYQQMRMRHQELHTSMGSLLLHKYHMMYMHLCNNLPNRDRIHHSSSIRLGKTQLETNYTGQTRKYMQ